MRKNKVLTMILFAFVFSVLTSVSAYGATALKAYDNKATAQTVIIDNKYIDGTTKAGTITLKANTFAAGDIVTIIDSKKAKLGDITIEDATKDYTLEVTTLTKKSGSIGVYVTPAAATYKVSKTVTLKYAAQKSLVVDPTAISIVGNADTDDVLTMTGIETGDTVNVYAATAADTEKKTLAKGTSKGTSVAIKLGKNNISTTTGIRVSITKKDCSESDKVLIKGDDLKYTAAPVTTDITSSYVIKSAALVCRLAPKDIINIYSADPTQYLSKYPSKDAQTALKAMLLGTKTVGAKDSTVFITFKNSLSEGAKVYITKKSTGKSVTASMSVSQETETAGTINTYVIKNEALISALAPKDIVNIYSADPTQYLVEKPSKADTAALKAMLIGTKTVGAKDSYVLITFKSELSEGTTVYITKKSTGQAVSAPISQKVQAVAGGGSGGGTTTAAPQLSVLGEILTPSGNNYTINLNKGTSSVVINAILDYQQMTPGQSVTVGGTNRTYVTAGGMAPNTTYTVDTSGISSGGSYTFTLTVSKTGETSRTLNISVTVSSTVDYSAKDLTVTRQIYDGVYDLSFGPRIGAASVKIIYQTGGGGWADYCTIASTDTHVRITEHETTTYKIVAYDDNGNVLGESNTMGLNYTLSKVPISDLAGTAGTNQVTLTFSASPDAESVKVEVTTGGGVWRDVKLISPVSPTSISCTVTGADNGMGYDPLSNGTAYAFHLVITGGPSQGLSNVVSVTPVAGPLPKVKNLVLSAAGVATWDACPNASGYEVILCKVDGDGKAWSQYDDYYDDTTTSIDFKALPNANYLGFPGNFFVRVIALGDTLGINYKNSPGSDSNQQYLP